MYSDFFGLKHSPFNNTPDPRFFFNTPDHEEAVASLVYAAQERKGFALLTGEVGSGKTLVSRLVLSRLERSAKFAVVHNTRVGPRELLFSICREFDVRVAADASAPEMSRALEEFLLDQYARDRLAVVIVDEAQHLTTESFEELRLLGNLEADDAKLLSVLILGQPELQAVFRLSEMQQLQQRLFRSYHLKALTRELTEGYIAHRLRVAGMQKAQAAFDRSALDAVYAASGGIPRLINQICDGAMLAAYTRNTKKITAAIVEEVLEQCRTPVAPPRSTAPFKVQAAPTNEQSAWGNPPQRLILETGPAEDAVRSLDRRVREVVEDCERARTSFDKALASAKDEFTRLQTDVVANGHSKRSLTDEIDRSVEAAKRELEAQIEVQRAKTEAIRSAIDMAADRAARQVAGLKVIADQAKGGAVADLQSARAELDRRIAETTRLGLDIESRSEGLSAQMTAALQKMQRALQESLQESKHVGEQFRAQSEASLAQLRAAMEQVTERADRARREVVELADQLNSGSLNCVESIRQTADALLHQIDDRSAAAHKNLRELAEQVKGGTVADLLAARVELENRIAEAAQLGLDIESRSDGLTAQVTAALHEMRRALQETVRESKQSNGQSRELTEASLSQLRTAMEQITHCADTARQDLVELADQVTSGSARSVEGLKGIVAELLQQIDDKTAHYRRETEQSCDRMGRLEHRFGEGVASAKAAVQQIIVDARSQFDAAQMQTADILTQAQAAAAATHEQAAIALAEARGSAQRLREQMEQDAQRADAAAANNRRELQDLRADLRKDRDQVRDQIIESKALLSESRQEAARIIEQARIESSRLIEMANATTSRLFEEAGRFERESQARAERIIHHARETEGRVDSLLRLPKEIIDEANAKTASLAELSKSLTSVIAQLGAAGAAARAQNQEIIEASDLAQERLEGLRSHTTRVGQLVGIIRQLYGIMDARIEGLRGRLDQAENLCRTVPQEIDGLRSALGGGRNGEHSMERMRTNAARLKDAPQSSRGKAIILKPTGGAPSERPAPAMLGDIVSRNRKLHEWLRETLREAESSADHDTGRRINPAERETKPEAVNA